METRIMVAYALCAAMALFFTLVIVRYMRIRRQFKIRQSGRGKNVVEADQTPSE